MVRVSGVPRRAGEPPTARESAGGEMRAPCTPYNVVVSANRTGHDEHIFLHDINDMNDMSIHYYQVQHDT